MKLFRYLLIFILPLLSLITVSCSDELDFGITGNGEPVDIQVEFSVPSPGEREVLSRAVGEINPQVYDMMVLAFDGSGKLLQRYYFTDISEGITHCVPEYSTDDFASLSLEEGSDSDGGILNMRVPSGKGYLMAVANIDVKSSPILSEIVAVTTRDELLAIQARENHFDSEISTMGGAYNDSYNVTFETFNPSGAITFRSGKLPGRIHFVPSSASVKININGKGPNSKGGVFSLDSYELVNLPRTAPVFYSIGTNASVASTLINTGSIGVFDETGVNSYSFGFNLLEYDRRSSKSIATYGQRAAWSGMNTSGFKVFSNAPDGAPYLVIRGTYSGQSGYVNENGSEISSGNVSAEVAYFIFLGHDSDTDFSDYRTLRNWQYTYNITINGIREITVEVNKKTENRTDAEGDVLVMDNDSSHRFDSHYCQSSFSMTYEEIRELYERELLGFRVVVPAYGVDETMFLKRNNSVSISTNNTNAYINENSAGWGIYNLTTGELQSGSTAYANKRGYMDLNNLACIGADWLKFYRHQTGETDTGWQWLINYADVYKKFNGSNNPYLLSIYRFLWDLAEIAKNQANKGKTFYYTVFAQENYYGNNWNDRMLLNHGTSGTSGSIHWSQFVNVSDRKVMMFPVTKISNDKQSTFSNPRRVFAQRSIRTIYKPEPGYEAWGTESIEEFIQPVTLPTSQKWFKGSDWTSARRTIRIAQENASGKRTMFSECKDAFYTEDQYGRKPAFDNFKSKNWTDYLNYASKYENSLHYRISGNLKLNSNYGLAQQIAACLGRNRDLNGNGKIDATEIRWYVPSIEQLQNLYIGNSGLPTEARIYQKEANEGKWVYKHYISSSRVKGDDTNTVLWAEEGPSTGLLSNSYAYAVHVRCVRDLGTNLNEVSQNWIPFMSNTVGSSVKNAGGYIEIDRLNDNCIRSSLENKDLSGVVTTFSNSNRPAKSFYYANRNINEGATKTFSYTNGNTYIVPDWTSPLLIRIDTENRRSESTPQRQSLCARTFGQGWRTPTISEVGLMFQCGVFPREDNILSRTRYVFWQQNNRGGIDLINNTGNDTSGRDPHSFCEGQFRLRYPWENITLPTDAKAGNITQISGHYGSIRCVKDRF